MPEQSTKPVTEWKSMGSLNRERAVSTGHGESTTEWPSMRKLGAFMKRKSSRVQAKQNQLTRGASKVSPTTTRQAPAKIKMSDAERVKRLESELAEVRLAAKEKLDDLELKVASRDAVLRRRAVNVQDLEAQLADAKEESSVLAVRVEELEALAVKFAQAQNAMTKEIEDRNEVLKIREDEISRVRHENRPRPIEGLIRTAVVASTGAMAVLASAAASR